MKLFGMFTVLYGLISHNDLAQIMSEHNPIHSQRNTHTSGEPIKLKGKTSSLQNWNFCRFSVTCCSIYKGIKQELLPTAVNSFKPQSAWEARKLMGFLWRSSVFHKSLWVHSKLAWLWVHFHSMWSNLFSVLFYQLYSHKLDPRPPVYLPSGHVVVSHYSHTKHKMLISTHNIISRYISR